VSDIENFENEGGAPENIKDIPVQQVSVEHIRHEEMMEMLGGIFVQLSRIYDVLMLGLPGASVSRKEVDSVHEAGELYGSPPTLKENAWE
jgi:hypothetical protein